MTDGQQQIDYKNKAKGFWITHKVSKKIKDIEIGEEIDFEDLEFEVLEMKKNVVKIRNLILYLHS